MIMKCRCLLKIRKNEKKMFVSIKKKFRRSNDFFYLMGPISSRIIFRQPPSPPPPKKNIFIAMPTTPLPNQHKRRKLHYVYESFSGTFWLLGNAMASNSSDLINRSIFLNNYIFFIVDRCVLVLIILLLLVIIVSILLVQKLIK